MEAIQPVIIPEADGSIEHYAFHEVVLAKDQPEYNPLPVAIVHKATVPVLSRWRPTAAELELLLQGADIVLQVTTLGGGFPPINLQVVPRDANARLAVV
jgi:hypothetical protein